MMSENISKNIRILLASKNLNKSWLAKSTGVTASNITILLKRLDEGGGANIITLEKIAKALDVSIAEIIN